MSSDYVKQVTVTGDVSTLAEDDELLLAWANETAKEMWEQKPEFACLHVQGLRASEQPDEFAARILKYVLDRQPNMRQFECARAFFDTSNTGLGSLYLFRGADDVQFFDRYHNSGYRKMLQGDELIVGGSEAEGFIANTFEQTFDFERDYYRSDGSRDVSNQRTGYLLARFRIHGKEMTFVNLRLHSVPYEDVKELVEQPDITRAAHKRQQQIDALLKDTVDVGDSHTLLSLFRLDSEGLRDDAILVAGAFNAQLQETRLLGDLASTQRSQTFARTADDGSVHTLEQVDRHGRTAVTVEQRRFDLHSIHDWFFRLGRGQMAKRYNGELASVVFQGRLLEESVFFQPSRHYGKGEESEDEFMRTLCPAWGDRVLYNDNMNELFRHDSFCASGLYYGIVGEKVPIGQFKPVSLHATICLK